MAATASPDPDSTNQPPANAPEVPEKKEPTPEAKAVAEALAHMQAHLRASLNRNVNLGISPEMATGIAVIFNEQCGIYMSKLNV